MSMTQCTSILRLLTKLNTIIGDIGSLQNSQEARMQSLQGSYTKHEGSMIQHLCLNINTTVDRCDENTVSSSFGNEQYTKKDLCMSINSILDEFDRITVKELKEMKDEIISLKSSIHNCSRLQNDLKRFHQFIQKIEYYDVKLFFIASIKCDDKIQQVLAATTSKSDKVLTVQEKSVHNVRKPGDSDKSIISGLCVLPDGRVLVADKWNNTIMLLNQEYQVVSHLGVIARPQGICRITPNEVAVTVNNRVQFITVNQSKLVTGMTFQLHHTCTGIAHHEGDLFICSHTALQKFSLNGELVRSLYENTSADLTGCAVSPTGDKLYITNFSKLLTLDRYGTVLAIFRELGAPHGVNVTPAGQVVVYDEYSGTLVQVDFEGRRKLATLATWKRDGRWVQTSVCYSSTPPSIIVGQGNIIVFKVEYCAHD